MHSSQVAVAVAPRGYRSGAGQRVERVTVAVDGTAATQLVVQRAASVAAQVGARLRLVTFAVRAGTMFPPEVGLHAEDKVVQVWREDADRIVHTALADLGQTLVGEPEYGVADARTWAEALDEPGWVPGDVLVIGSSSSQSLVSRVFLGSTAARILRHSPVPVVVVP
ncbi:MAG TPA: universal stress protein [Candidatus Lustribacter sp.]|nr:universal stress protein [Candidatus Lustribacter sp.]